MEARTGRDLFMAGDDASFKGLAGGLSGRPHSYDLFYGRLLVSTGVFNQDCCSILYGGKKLPRLVSGLLDVYHPAPRVKFLLRIIQRRISFTMWAFWISTLFVPCASTACVVLSSSSVTFHVLFAQLPLYGLQGTSEVGFSLHQYGPGL